MTGKNARLQRGVCTEITGLKCDAMSQFSVGQHVKIQCEVQRGAFPTELLVTFEAVEGPISGFVRSEDVQRLDGHKGRGYHNCGIKRYDHCNCEGVVFYNHWLRACLKRLLHAEWLHDSRHHLQLVW